MDNTQDQVQRALELDGTSGSFELDESGYERFIPSEKELADINKWLAEEHEIAEEEYRPIYEEAAEDLQTYKATKSADLIDGKEAILPAPLARIAVDQYVATIYNMVMRPSLIVSFQPYFKDDYDVVVPPPTSTPEEQMMAEQMAAAGQAPIIKKSAEDTAFYLETGYTYKLREGLDFGPRIREAIIDAVTVSRGYIKVCREKVEQPIFAPKKNGTLIEYRRKEEAYSQVGDSIRWHGVPVFNILKRIHEDDLDTAEWISERTPVGPEDFRGRALSDEFFLLKEEEIDQLSRMTCETKTDAQKTTESTTQNKYSPMPKNMIDLRLVWFYRFLKFKDEATGKTKVKRVSLMGDYHATAKKLCSVYVNPYNHQKRPYAVLHQMKDAHSDSGSSTTSVSKWFQKVATHAIQSEIKNAFHANNLSYWWDPTDPDASSVFSSGDNFKFHAGRGIPAKHGESWGVVRAGEANQSLVPLTNFIKGWAREVQNMSSLETGDSMPSRTPSSSISQVLQQGMQQPLMFLRALNDFVRRLIILDMETRRQFEPLGEVIPTRDRETRETINIPFRFPLGEVAKNFRIGLTAADEALAQEHELEQLIMLLDRWQAFTQFVATMAGPMQQMTPAQRQLMMRVIDGGQTLFNRVIQQTRTDKEKFDLKPAIDALNQEIDMAMMQQQQMQEMEAANAQADPAAAGEPVPGAEGYPDEGGPGGIAPEPGMESDLGEAPPEGVPLPGEELV